MSQYSVKSGRSRAAVFAVLASVCCGCGRTDAPKLGDQPLPVSTPAVPPAEKAPKSPAGDFPVDELLATIREQSVFRKGVPWETVVPGVQAKAAKATTDEDKAKAVLDVFARMNDVHSALVVRGKRFSHYEGLDEPTRQKVLPQLARAGEQSGKPVAKLLDGRIGYVLVPGMQVGTPEVAEAARSLHEQVREVANQKPTGWVVDLRLNTGGNLSPMLTGLRPPLGDGVVGGTIDADDRMVQEWVLKPDGLYWHDDTGDRRFVELDMSAQTPDPTTPVAVLLGPATMSSGQGTALAFRGRPQCRLIGEPTAKGYTTVIAPRTFGPDVSVSLAVGFMADRAGQPCKLQVLPDETVEGGDAFDAPADDKKVQAAIRWLNRKDK